MVNPIPALLTPVMRMVLPRIASGNAAATSRAVVFSLKAVIVYEYSLSLACMNCWGQWLPSFSYKVVYSALSCTTLSSLSHESTSSGPKD